MTLRVLRAADRPAVPWKNGGGVTREIAASPEGAPLDDFDWRVSLADVSADGPFSSFPGVDRTLTVVEGAGMDLMVGGEHHIVDEQYWPHDFPGDLETDGRLLGGPVVNLNVMYRRERTTAEVAVVRGTLRLLAPQSGTVLAVALEDGAVLDGHDIELDCYDAVVADSASPGVLRTQGWALLVTLSVR
ncbi:MULTISPECIES: HutD/Ves family protein [unclassified Streptomyces]|uniref:HutD/Ves family protein n=1 Tax=unclassified Streptomyces TaxID=2593676 RepID=UPI002DD98CA9|nr:MULTISPECIES: HutD family protein [unclassified Streptomyces]WSF87321.1 HutD family protein [Streptomyces sp. NBC_01744]WSC36437.1 HutD family protein [Streptomyces sp. NBC_01763]WSC44536.1 HutD family protein [Streptomyces sp. NBC_01762]WSC56483.1 HutD family protein [Streptomyces sp. NBC_01761]WSD24123.1 HutD family protein [Streptomyces sp. NBC_01751]